MSGKRRVFRITNRLNVSGVAKRLLDLLPRLRDCCDFQIITFKEPGTMAGLFEDLGIRVHSLPSRKAFDLANIRRMARLLRQERAEIVHTHHYQGSVQGMLAARLAGVPRVFGQVHVNMAIHWPGETPARKLQREIKEKIVHLLTADRILFVSEAIRREYLHHLTPRSLARRCEVLYNGYDLGDYPVRPAGPRPSRFRVGVMSRLIRGKNLSFFLDVAARLVRIRSDVDFLVIGDGPHRDLLEARARELGLTGRCTFAGMLQDPRQALRGLDALVFTSRNEGLPGSLIEPLLLGVPVLAVDTDMNREATALGRGGRCLEADPQVFALALDELFNRPEPSDASDFEGYRRAFDIHRLVERYRHMYLDPVLPPAGTPS